MVSVECFEQKQHTSTQRSVSSCVFDELLIFNFPQKDKTQVEEGVIKISVMDAATTPLQKQTMIGSCVFDVATIYRRDKDHELYREWTILVDDSNPQYGGAQGYLKLSIQVNTDIPLELRQKAHAMKLCSALLATSGPPKQSKMLSECWRKYVCKSCSKSKH